MNKTFTSSEVRDWERAYKGTGAAKVFGAFADLLEAREKAVPVAWLHPDYYVGHPYPDECISTDARSKDFGWLPLYTTPQPAQDAKDAARLEWYFGPSDKRDWLDTYMRGMREGWGVGQWRAAIDAAMAGESGNE